MEKTTTIFIGGTTFLLTEDAYEKLSEYLAALKEYFAHETSRDEIIRDVESRIAEKLIDKKDSMVVLSAIEAIIAEIGNPTELEGEDVEESRQTRRVETKGRKKLYRDMDNAWLGGVASGIAAYFDIDPLWVRGGFVVATFAWGFSIIAYIILWILFPEAKSSSQKLEMRGVHASFENITRFVKERAEEVQEKGVIKKFFDRIANIVRTLFRIFGKAIGVAFTVFPVLAMIGVTILFGAAVTNWDASFNDFPLRGAVPDRLILLGATAIYIVIFIPLLLLAASGIRIIRKHAMISTSVVLGLVGMWVLVLIAGGIVGTNIARHYTETLATDPQYKIETRQFDVSTFTKISVANGEHVTIKKGEVQEVIARARLKDFENTRVEVEDGVLVVERRKHYPKNCFFCENRGVEEIIVVTPDLEAISLKSARATFEEYSDGELSIEMSGGSLYGSLSVPVLNIAIDRGHIRSSIEADSLNINARHANLYLDGSAKNAKLYLVNSRLGDELFIIDSGELDAENSPVTAKILNRVGKDDEVKSLDEQ